MDERLKGIGPGGLVIINRSLLDGTASIAAGGNANSTVVDCEGFASAMIYVDAAEGFDLTIAVSYNNTDYYTMEANTAQVAGKNLYKADIRAAMYIRVNVKNNSGTLAMSPTANISLCTR